MNNPEMNNPEISELVAFVLNCPDVKIPESVRMHLESELNGSPELVTSLKQIYNMSQSDKAKDIESAKVLLENFVFDIKGILEG